MNTKEQSKTIRSILEDLRQDIESECDDKWTGPIKDPQVICDNINKLQDQALAEIEEVMNECKPEKHLVQEDSDIYDDYDHDREQLRHELQENNINIGHNSAIDLYEQNLLKALGKEQL